MDNSIFSLESIVTDYNQRIEQHDKDFRAVLETWSAEIPEPHRKMRLIQEYHSDRIYFECKRDECIAVCEAVQGWLFKPQPVSKK